MANFDADAAGILIGNDNCDIATALAASYRPQAASIEDSQPEPAATWTDRASFDAGLLAGLVLFIVWQLW